MKVRNCSMVFDENTVYGVRSGVHQCLLVVANDKHNVFLKSKAWKAGVVHAAAMLPRSEMLKVEKCNKGFTSEARLTKVQEMKQAGLGLKSAPMDSTCVKFQGRLIPITTKHFLSHPKFHMWFGSQNLFQHQCPPEEKTIDPFEHLLNTIGQLVSIILKTHYINTLGQLVSIII